MGKIVRILAACLLSAGLLSCTKDGNFDALRDLVPDSTLRYFESSEAAPVLARIRSEENVIHY